MANKKQIAQETKDLIFADYQNPAIKVHDIPKKYGISQRTMQEIVFEMGGAIASA